ncbi:unnamed protein product [Lepeophtheirus salmonis]|uniref:(salmon louse) hypothetical protein n=1 Tax=Lepeophtheirus salmonis TaxID=72036 RepID=A0A7R8CJF0_LEPSM|nr:unnamed protein product [Lepeophtheirus salmonis]CAF2838226.1 unnamed protein product [Lepeophtheirus salmonis]
MKVCLGVLEMASYRDEGDYFVRVGTVMTPNTFWVTKMPLGSKITDTQFGKIFDMEYNLQEKYNVRGALEDISELIPTIRVGIRVACRKHDSHQNWYRGEIVNVSCVRKLLNSEMVTFSAYGISTPSSRVVKGRP